MLQSEHNNAPYVLMIDDDLEDCMLIGDAMMASKLDYQFHFIWHSEEMIELLNEPVKRFPDFILLDLNMPKFSGKEVLKAIKKTSIWKDITVFIFTISENEEDVNFCFKHGCTSFLVKPSNHSGMKKLMTQFKHLWEMKRAENKH